MSYILEALKRAERERHVGKTPTVETLAQAAAPPAARWRPARSHLLAAASLLIAAGAGLILWLRPAVPAPRAVPAAPAAATSPAATAPAPAAPAAEPEAGSTAALEDAGAVSSLDDLMDGGDSQTEAILAAAAPGEPAELQPQDLTQPAAPVAEASGTAAAPPVAMPNTARPLREMPDAYRARFPVQGLDVHVYDPDPARRWIMVAGKRYREGQVVDGGAQLAQIVDSGAIFAFDGAQVLFPVR